MNQSEGPELGCVCPECGYRCKACLGTNSVVPRDQLKNLRFDPTLMNDLFGSVEPPPVRPGRNEADEYLD